MFQRWRWLTFLHWRYDPAIIRSLLPSALTLDTFDGAAWIGLTPFLLTGLRPPAAPALRWLSQFPETNVRTYVRGPDGQGGVWFFTLEADRLAAVVGARATYRLPYRWSQMRVLRSGRIAEYESNRKWPSKGAYTSIAIQQGEPLEAADFDNFLSARYRLYTLWSNRLAYAPIDHAPWPLYSARVLRLEQNLIERSGVPRPDGHPVVHYSPDLLVRIGKLQLYPQFNVIPNCCYSNFLWQAENMARGWESKGIEAQIEAAESGAAQVRPPVLTREQIELQHELESLELSRTRVLQDLAAARNPKYQDILQQSLAYLEAKIAALRKPA